MKLFFGARPSGRFSVRLQGAAGSSLKSALRIVFGSWSQYAVLILFLAIAVRADWPTLRGDSHRSGLVQGSIQPPFRQAWVRHFENERLGTAIEPIVAQNRVFVATHQGSLYALDAIEGNPLWRLKTHGAFLHSPAVAEGLVLAGNSDGQLFGVDASTGEMKWSLNAGGGGFAASPTLSDGTAFIGTRAGDFLAVDLKTGKVVWKQFLQAPIRQTAAFTDGSVFVTSEDLRVHCLDAATGRETWVSSQLTGQTARDYYPLVVNAGGRSRVVVRTNPILSMGNHIGRDRRLLCQNAGVDDSGWQKIDAWTKSEAARGNAELWAKEQAAIVKHLEDHREARTFFVLDAVTGQEFAATPVLWIAGCQAVGAMPALTRDGSLLTFYRSAYGNWNHGVAPLVALGLLDLAKNQIAPLEHQYGRRPAWNTFWGTADESQNFSVVGDTVLIVHQGTLSGFDLKSSKLFPIWGERDTYGGFRSPTWARNEWHGPGRGSVAVDSNRIYWLTGSRVLCLVAGEQEKRAEDVGINGAAVLTRTADKPPSPAREGIRARLVEQTRQVLSKRWAPLFVEPGLAGRDFSFDHSAELFEALAWAYPHLSANLQPKVKTFLAQEWSRHPPFSRSAWYSLKEGERRELIWTPDEIRSRLGQDKPHHPFGNSHSVWYYAERCGEWERVQEAWPQIKAGFDDFVKTAWRLDPAKG
ncbi:MAG: PQQ-like beta-propeller repeat protein, partial [Verrucomicrobia bacterium]|nr:PQQ-like beta-propeller repeat protein [Verrucomicrobiota bacterium]